MSDIDKLNNNIIAVTHISFNPDNSSSSNNMKTVLLGVDNNLRDEFQKQKKKNGLFEKLYDKLKNLTGFGNSSKTVDKLITNYDSNLTRQVPGLFRSEYVEKVISQYGKSKITKEEIDIATDKYRSSQKNAEQMFGNVTTSLITLASFFKAKNFLAELKAQKKLKAENPIFTRVINHIKDSAKYNKKSAKFIQFILNTGRKILKSNRNALIIGLPILALLGGTAKVGILGFNRIGSKEFYVDKKLKNTDKAEYKRQKKQAGKAQRKEFFKNLITGAGLGIITPVAAVLGGIAGVPVFVAGVLGLNYLNSDKKDKSFNGFVKSLKDNWLMNTAGTAVMTAVALKKARFSSVLSKNLDSTVKLLQDVTLKPSEFASGQSSYDKIKDIMLKSPAINDIINSREYISVSEQIKRLTDQNIFAVKFLQTSGEKSKLVRTLIEDCPPSRTLEEAQAAINKLIGNTDYKVKKLLGTGTIAETYLAKDKNGKEVCIKIVKDGISAEKIQKDKEAFINLVTGGKPREQITKEQDYLVRCIEDYANGISKEIDLENEMKAAQSLKKFTKKANVVVPIEAKPGIYVMEKAKGISVQTLKEYYACTSEIKRMEKMLKDKPNSIWYKENLQRCKAELERIKAKAPDFDDFELSNDEVKKIMLKYIDLQTEQFSKISRSGKPIHADIHPGNVIVNIAAVKGKDKGKIFTLIDTGNVINVSKEQSLDMLKFLDYIKKANSKDISRAVVADSILPAGLTREEAAELVEKELSKCFFDNSTQLKPMTIDNLFILTDNIQRKFNIIPNNTQLNLEKAKNASIGSFKDLIETFLDKKYGAMTDNPGVMEMANFIKDGADMGKKWIIAQKIQNFKNLFKKSFGEIMKSIFNKNNKKANSVEALTYKLKQNMGFRDGIEAFPKY